MRSEAEPWACLIASPHLKLGRWHYTHAVYSCTHALDTYAHSTWSAAGDSLGFSGSFSCREEKGAGEDEKQEKGEGERVLSIQHGCVFASTGRWALASAQAWA